MRICPTMQAMNTLLDMTPEQLLYYSTSRMVYLKTGIYDGERAFVIYDTEGRPIEAVDAIEDVWARIAERGLGLATVH